MKALLSSFVVLFSLSAIAETGVVALVNLSPAGNFQAKSSTVQGTAKMTGDEVKASNVKIPLNTLKTGIELRDKHMKEKYLETQTHPDAELIEASGKGGKGRGKLKLHGIEKEVSGTYKIVGGKELEAEFPIKLSDYGITGIKYMGVGVKDEVKITVTLPVTK